MSTSELLLGFLLVSSLAFALPASADGTGTFAVIERIRLPGLCGSSRDAGNLTFTLVFPENTWSVQLLGETYNGIVVPQRALTGRFILQMDPSSSALLAAALADRASERCFAQVHIDSLSLTKMTLKLNKQQSEAKLQLAATTMGEMGSGRYSLKGAGLWIPQHRIGCGEDENGGTACYKWQY